MQKSKQCLDYVYRICHGSSRNVYEKIRPAITDIFVLFEIYLSWLWVTVELQIFEIFLLEAFSPFMHKRLYCRRIKSSIKISDMFIQFSEKIYILKMTVRATIRNDGVSTFQNV